MLPSECSHSIRLGNLCVNCGKEVPNTELYSTLYTNSFLKATKKGIKKITEKHTTEMLKSKKLALVIDIDQTILHACPGHVMFGSILPEIHHIFVNSSPITIKLRPNLDLFLSSLSKIYILHIYTLGTREYANKILELIDPSSFLFSNRVMTRSESYSTYKDIQKIFTSNKLHTVIIDDRADVWNYCNNLFLIRPYKYFEYGDINEPISVSTIPDTSVESNTEINLSTNKILEEKNKIEQNSFVSFQEKDKDLFLILNILKKIHKKFFFNCKKDVRKIVKKYRNKVFGGTNIHLCFNNLEFKNFIEILVEFYGGKCVDLRSANIVVGNNGLDYKWIFESIFCYRMVDYDKYKSDTVSNRKCSCNDWEEEIDKEFDF
ncbi:CTD phosphatase Fcp1 [Hamiltosporidium tvaerminnensis]|nr:CTD phosphatase Fcp1 [Hamiltosporidium tvaerminnensis]